MSVCRYLNLSLKAFDDEDHKWYNLDTGHRIANLKGKVFLQFPKVASESIDALAEFIRLNDLSDYQAESDLQNQLIQKLSSAESANGTAELMTSSLLISRVFCLCQVVKLTDGDTIEVEAEVPLNDLACPRIVKDNSEIKAKQQVKVLIDCHEQKTDINIRLRLDCRLFGIDAAERKTTKGKIATEVLRRAIDQVNGRLYGHFLGTQGSNYGRSLVHFYFDSKRKYSVSNFMLAYSHPVHGKIAITFYGTKDKANGDFHADSNPVLDSDDLTNLDLNLNFLSSIQVEQTLSYPSVNDSIHPVLENPKKLEQTLAYPSVNDAIIPVLENPKGSKDLKEKTPVNNTKKRIKQKSSHCIIC